MEKVELHPAFMWDCPECGVENFERSISVSNEQLGEILIQMGVEDSPGIDYSTVHWCPMKVICDECHREFATTPYGSEKDDIE